MSRLDLHEGRVRVFGPAPHGMDPTVVEIDPAGNITVQSGLIFHGSPNNPKLAFEGPGATPTKFPWLSKGGTSSRSGYPTDPGRRMRRLFRDALHRDVPPPP